MRQTLQDILEAALQLSEDERIVIAGHLLKSVTPYSDDSGAERWCAELTRRWQELETDTVQAVPWSEVERQLREMIAEHDG